MKTKVCLLLVIATSWISLAYGGARPLVGTPSPDDDDGIGHTFSGTNYGGSPTIDFPPPPSINTYGESSVIFDCESAKADEGYISVDAMLDRREFHIFKKMSAFEDVESGEHVYLYNQRSYEYLSHRTVVSNIIGGGNFMKTRGQPAKLECFEINEETMPNIARWLQVWTEVRIRPFYRGANGKNVYYGQYDFTLTANDKSVYLVVPGSYLLTPIKNGVTGKSVEFTIEEPEQLR